MKRYRAAIPVPAVTAVSGGATEAGGVEKDELEGAWGEVDEMAKVGEWGGGE